MKTARPIHPDFQFFLDFKDKTVVELFKDLRNYILELMRNTILEQLKQQATE